MKNRIIVLSILLFILSIPFLSAQTPHNKTNPTVLNESIKKDITPTPTPTETPEPTPYGPNLIVNGDFPSFTWVQTIISTSEMPPIFDFHYSDAVPLGATAPCLRWSAATTSLDDETIEVLYQPVTLEAGREYIASMCIKEVAHAGDGWFVELYLLPTEPQAGVDFSTNKIIGTGSWVGGAGINGKIEDTIPLYVAPSSGIFYFVIKIGRLGAGTTELLIDNIKFENASFWVK